MIKYYEALQGVVRSTPSKASIRTKCIAHRCRLYHQTIFGRAGFAIISITGASRTHRSHTASFSCVLTVLVSEVVIRFTFRRRSFSTITTLQTSYHFLFFRIKGCLSSGIAFKASCQQQGSAKKTNNEQFILCWRFQSTSPQHYFLRRANLNPICISLSLAFTCIYQCA